MTSMWAATSRFNLLSCLRASSAWPSSPPAYFFSIRRILRRFFASHGLIVAALASGEEETPAGFAGVEASSRFLERYRSTYPSICLPTSEPVGTAGAARTT